MTVAWLFPGQGSQHVGMGRDLYEHSPAARAVFRESDRLLGFALSALCFEGPEERLTATENAQPALLTVCTAKAGRPPSSRATAWASTARWWRPAASTSRRRSPSCGGAAS
jgi:acyl transferase domain-containing protein